MNANVFDTAALIALERGEPAMWWRLRAFVELGNEILVPTTVIAQCWRGHARQANLSRALEHCTIVPFDNLAREVGVLCGRTKTSDIVDAHVALVTSAYEAETLFTGDPKELQPLLDACGGRAVLFEC